MSQPFEHQNRERLNPADVLLAELVDRWSLVDYSNDLLQVHAPIELRQPVSTELTPALQDNVISLDAYRTSKQVIPTTESTTTESDDAIDIISVRSQVDASFSSDSQNGNDMPRAVGF